MSTFSISELATEAGVTVRTIRYYVSEGLLPTPGGRGRYAKYGGEYLDRLRLISRLKEGFLPLAEIRRRVSHLSHREVLDLLAEEKGRLTRDEVAPDLMDHPDHSTRMPWIRYQFEEGVELHVAQQLHPWRERIVRRIVADIQSQMKDW